MNTLNGYSKSTLSDKYVLTAAGGHRQIYDSEFIVGTQTAATGSWTGVTTDSELYDGKQISYWLPFAGKDSATLNLTLSGGGTTGAVNCYYGSTTRLTTHFGANRLVRLTYRKNVKIGDNTYTGWWADADYNDGNTYTAAYCVTEADKPNKAASCSNYKLQNNSYIPILIINTNSSANAITLNINYTGAKPVYINGNPSSTTNYVLPAGTYIAYYDGSCYQLRTDGILPGKIQDSVTVNGYTVESDVPKDAKFTDTTYSVMNGATSTAAGTSGLVPAPAANKHNLFLKGDGTWAVPANTTYHTMVGATSEADGASGLVPKPVIANRNQYLKGDGTWATPTNTTYSVMSQAEATEGTKTDGRLITAAVLRTTISNAISGKLDSSTASSTYATKTELTDGLNKKVDKVSGKGLSTNDYTTDEKNKLAGIAAGAEVNQNAFAKISDGTTTIVADAKQDTLNVVAGFGVSLTLDADKDKLTIGHADTSNLSGAYGPNADVTGSNGATISVPEITVDTFGHVTGVTNRTYTSKDTTYSAITADELNTGTATTSRVITAKILGPWVKGQIDSKIAAADAMIYKGTLGTNGTITELPNTTAKTGWTYKVITAGTYADVKCEIGDMIICLTDGSSSTNATWTVVQNNIDGAVIGPSSSTDGHVAVFSGTSGKVIKNSGFTIGKSVPSNALFTDTNTKVNVTLGTTTKAYLLGTSTTPTSTAQGVTAIADTNVYLDEIEGSLTAKIFKGALSGNALTATKLKEGKTLTIGKTGKTFDGSEDVSWTLAEIGAAATSHGTHVTYSTTAPLANGTASPGTANNVSRGDHVHPLQTTVSGNAGTATTLKTARTIDGVLFDGSANVTHYAECETDKDTAAKTIALTNFKLEKGAKIIIRFAVTNNAANPTLNVNSTGAKAIYYRGSAIGSWRLVAKKLYSLVYDGTNWEVVGDLDTDTYTSAYCSTAKNTAAKLATCSNYVLTDNTYTHVIIAYANEAQSELTLNINSKGAKPIYINGTISSSSNYTLPAGTYIVYYDGSAYHFRTDGVIPGKVKDATTVNGLTVQTAVPKNAVFTDTKSFTITANANDDDVIVLSGTNGTNAVSYTATHAKTFGNNTEPYTVKYSSGNTVTSITGSGASGTIKIPQITVDEYGHVRYGADESVSITMPTVPTTLKNPKALKFGNKSYDGSSEVTLTSTDLGIIAHATCSTDAGTAAKVITLKNAFNWELRPGHIIIVTFDKTNTASNPTFNVNNTGAKSVWYNSAVITTGSLSMAGTANRPMMFMYDGAQYIFIGWSYDANNTYSTYTLGIGYGTCSTATGTTAKVVTLANYQLVKGGIVSVKFDNAVDAESSMNINTKGAKSIYYRSSAIVGGIIPAGAIATFIYDGTYYHLIGLDTPRVSISRNLTTGTKIGTITIDNQSTDLYCHTNTDTKNTAGSTNSTEKLFLIGATTQAANPTTYSNSGVFATNGTLSAAAFVSGAGTSDFTAGTVKLDTLNLPTSSNGTTFGAGSNGQFLKSNGTTVYWGWDNNSWRALQVNGTEIASTGTGTYPLNFVSGTGISVSGVAGTTETKLNKITITNTGVRSVTIGTGDNANKLAVNTNGSVTNLTIPYSTRSAHLVGGAVGNIVYQSDANTTSFLANPTTNGYVLKFSTSTGLPYWASDNNYYRPISVGGTSILGNNNTALNLVAGTNISLTPEKSGSSYTGKVTIAAPNVTPVTQSIPYIIGPDTDTTAGTWTGSYSKITAYTEGLTIMYVPKVAGSSTTTTLNLNGLGAQTCYLKGSSKLTTHFAANSVVVLTYRENVVISDKTYTGWWANSQYDSDNYYYQLLAYTSVTAGTNGIKQYSLMLEDADGNRQSLTTSSGAGTSKGKNPVGFKLGSKVLFYSGSSDLEAGTNTGEWTAYSAYLINFKYSSNCNATLEARKMVYLIGTVSNGLFYLDDAIYTQTPNNTSKVYIPLGYARTNGYQIDFDNVYGPVVYNGSTLVPYSEKSKVLDNFYPSRPTSLNVTFQDGGIRTFKATASTSVGKCSGAGHVLHFAWDNGAAYGYQLALINADHDTYGLEFRGHDGSSWKNWSTVLTSLNTNISNGTITINGTSIKPITAHQSLAGYLPLSGGTMTGLLTTSTGNNLGIKIGKTNITTTGSSSGDIIVQSNDAIRFGVDAWSYDKWAGLKYDHSNKTVYLGIADGTIFTANTNQSGGRLFLPGISNAYIGNGWYTILHSNNYTSYTVKTVSGTVSGTAVKYVKLGTLPDSSESTYDSFVITGSVGGFSSDAKSHINIQVSRRNGINYRGSVQQVNTNTWDIGVNSSGEIFLIFSGGYCAYTVSMHTVGGTISYSTSATPKDTTWTLLSNSSNISIYNKLGIIDKANNGVFYIEGTGTTAGVWLGSHTGITSYYKGLTIAYKIPIAGTSTEPYTTLNINGLGAKNCYINASKVTTHYPKDAVVVFVYDGTCFKAYNYSDGNTYTSAYCQTKAEDAAKSASCTGYTATENTYIHVTIVNANTAASALTLNINSKGAKPIYINGVASSATNYTLPAGTYIVYYNGTNYYFRTDGILPGSIELASKVTCTQGTGDSYRPVVVTTQDNRIFYGTKVTANYSTGDLKATSVTINTLNAPTSNGSTTLGPGANGQVLKSNGTSVYWATDNYRSITDSYTGTSTSITFSQKGANNLYKNFINQSIPYIVGPSTDAEGVWTGTHSGITAYVDGLTIMYVPGVKGKSPTTLNINELGAKTCHYNNSSTINNHYAVGTPILFTYINGYWKRADYTENTYLDAVSWTASGTAAKGASCSNYILTAKSYLYVVMNYDNTYAGAITLNVASKGAKPIYINGSASSATNYTLPKGGYMTYYDGTNYHFRTDGILPGSIDMLDGYHASSFNLRSQTYVSSTTKVGYINNTEIRALAGTDITDVNDFPTINTDGIRLIYNTYPKTASNIPTSPNGANALLTLIKGNYSTTTSYGSQLAFPNDGKIYSRVLSAGAFGTWQQIAFKSDIPSFGAKGSATKGIYLSAANTFAEMTYSLNATVNGYNNTMTPLAYYSAKNTISPYTSTCGDSYKPIYLDNGIPIECYSKYWGAVSWGTNCSGTIHVYQFGPIVILQGYVYKLQLSNTSLTNYVFKLPEGVKTPTDVCGFCLVQKSEYENDRNTVIILSGQYGYCNSNYNTFNPNGTNYYFTACYV